MPVKIVEMILDETTDTKILIETTEAAEPETTSGMRSAGISDKLKSLCIKSVENKFANAMGIISHSSNVLLAEMDKIEKKPDAAQIEFGIKINSEGKAMLASAGIEANYKVTLSWKAKG